MILEHLKGFKEEFDNKYEDYIEISIVNVPGNFTISGEKKYIIQLERIALEQKYWTPQELGIPLKWKKLFQNWDLS